jgi:hypothetical protein
VQNIAHGAEPDHKQTELGLGVQTPIFSHRRVGKGRRNSAGEPVDCGRFVLNFDLQAHGLEG